MPYKDREKQKEYQRQWMEKRRDDFFCDKVCKVCGASEDLVLHHRDPTKKEDHRIWSWSEERRQKELDKCDIVCDTCHIDIHNRWRTANRPPHGVTQYNLGCRCDICRAANAKKARKRRSKLFQKKI